MAAPVQYFETEDNIETTTPIGLFRGNPEPSRSRQGCQRGYFLSGVNLVLVVVLLVVLLFSLRLLLRPAPSEVGYSDRYYELTGRDNLSAAEARELEVEKCRFKRDLLARHDSEQQPGFEAASSAYRQSCAELLPR